MEICANKWYIWNQNPSWISTSSLTVPGSFSTSTQHRIEHYGATAASFITLSGSSSNAVLKDLILEINPGHDGLITLKDFRFQGTHCTPCGCFHCSLLEKYIKCEERESLFFFFKTDVVCEETWIKNEYLTIANWKQQVSSTKYFILHLGPSCLSNYFLSVESSPWRCRQPKWLVLHFLPFSLTSVLTASIKQLTCDDEYNARRVLSLFNQPLMQPL